MCIGKVESVFTGGAAQLSRAVLGAKVGGVLAPKAPLKGLLSNEPTDLIGKAIQPNTPRRVVNY
jgi:hypothetical protein